jgi:hypothetical protein
MRGNKEDIQDMGSWAYLGNETYELISNLSSDHKHIFITLDKEAQSFNSGIEYSSDSAVGRELVYVKV